MAEAAVKEKVATAEDAQELTDGFHLIIDALKLNGVKTIYGVPGIPITDFGRMAQAAGIRVLSFRHEQNAGYAASGPAPSFSVLWKYNPTFYVSFSCRGGPSLITLLCRHCPAFSFLVPCRSDSVLSVPVSCSRAPMFLVSVPCIRGLTFPFLFTTTVVHSFQFLFPAGGVRLIPLLHPPGVKTFIYDFVVMWL